MLGKTIISAYELLLNAKKLSNPEIILRFGDVPTSQRVNDWINQAALKAYIHISADGRWADDNFRVSHLIQAEPATFCQDLSQLLGSKPSLAHWAEAFKASGDDSMATLREGLWGYRFF
ncbi:MAG: hypothetical protein R2865_03235 [Deinococcales bacterium]